MMRSAIRMRRTSHHPAHLDIATLWHAMPWNALYWLVVFFVGGLATAFAVRAELDQRELLGIVPDKIAEVAPGDRVRVVLVLNGDEILIEHNGRRARLRMLGIRSFDPVVSEREITAFGDASVQFLKEWILNKEVEPLFDVPIMDAHNRYLAYISLNGVDINKRMVEEGISMVYTEFKTTREQEYLAAELNARTSRRGIWGGSKAHRRIDDWRRDWAGRRVQRHEEAPADPLLTSTGE
jgi:endonuclease YncB( thermonuclease family)